MNLETLPRFMEILAFDEPPMGVFYTDELSFTMPLGLFREMLVKFENSFLKTKTGQTVQKKIARSKRAWGEQSRIVNE